MPQFTITVNQSYKLITAFVANAVKDDFMALILDCSKRSVVFGHKYKSIPIVVVGEMLLGYLKQAVLAETHVGYTTDVPHAYAAIQC